MGEKIRGSSWASGSEWEGEEGGGESTELEVSSSHLKVGKTHASMKLADAELREITRERYTGTKDGPGRKTSMMERDSMAHAGGGAGKGKGSAKASAVGLTSVEEAQASHRADVAADLAPPPGQYAVSYVATSASPSPGPSSTPRTALDDTQRLPRPAHLGAVAKAVRDP